MTTPSEEEARAAAQAAGDPDWMNATGGTAPSNPKEEQNNA